MAVAKFTKELTELLHKIGAETHTMTESGDMLTKNEVLIRLLWDTALGYEEKKKDDDGKETVTVHKPQKWAIELVYNRKEGGIAGATPDASGGISAAKQVRTLANKRLNAAAEKATDE